MHLQHGITEGFWLLQRNIIPLDCWLDEIIGRYTDASINAEMEHFQNQFIRHDEVIDILKHDVRKHESQLVKYAQVKITIGCNRLKSKF